MEPPAPTIQALPIDDRPRERLLAHGSGALSDAELVAVLLRTGVRGCSALAMARQLLDEVGGLSGLVGRRPPSLSRAGLGPVKAATLLAAVELGRRLSRQELPKRLALGNLREVAEYLTLRYCRPDQEVMGALYLDCRHRLLSEREIFRGTMSRLQVEPRMILKEALLRDAAGVVVFHTHPSGDPAPSVEDLLFTRRLRAAAQALGVELHDHLILAAVGRWLSLRQEEGW